ncbi:hypothetical protein HanHA300_Chr12g0437101 [Helianthus annuus]|nr:hypothetical protein HanHA300_Chr12g0437101 [Helianthus annuus]KAJ0492413.1 hypothetical protein HanIR_Chr12g0574601 [Helianthus annuus]KAJ0504667.1 hypothetical protein HanHA89_Chr12g0461801 [Helianthus annuus]KAJ0674396.1 hypothetical protein HanLR1_Chr12g0439451 [Helianthus annuus]
MVCPPYITYQVPTPPCYLISPKLFSHGVLLILPKLQWHQNLINNFHIFSISDEDIMMDSNSTYTVDSGQDFAALLLSPEYSLPSITPPLGLNASAFGPCDSICHFLWLFVNPNRRHKILS